MRKPWAGAGSVLVLVGALAVLAILFAWPIWLWRQGDVPNAITALVIVLVLLCWHPLKRFISRLGL